MRVWLYITLVFIFFCNNALSAIISRINSTDIESGAGRRVYHFTISEWGADSTPNPCFGEGSACAIFFNHRHSDTDSSLGGAAGVIKAGCIDTAATMDLLKSCLISQKITNLSGYPEANLPSTFNIPMNGTLVHEGPIVTSECVGLYYGTKASSLQPLPGSICGIAPSPTYSCELPSSINLNHGVLSPDEINGATITQNASLNCTGDLPMRLALEGATNGKLALGSSGIESTISINGKVMNDSGIDMDVKSGINNLTIKSTLAVSGKPKAGNYSGQGILMLAVQ